MWDSGLVVKDSVLGVCADPSILGFGRSCEAVGVGGGGHGGYFPPPSSDAARKGPLD